MFIFWRIFGLLLTAILLSGCVTPQAPVSRGVINKINRVGVISVAAQSFVRVGPQTLLGRPAEREVIDISSWKIDDQYEAQVASQLRRLPNVVPVLLPYRRADFLSINENLTRDFGRVKRGAGNWIAAGKPVGKYCSENSLDGLIIIAERMTNRYPDAAFQIFVGAGTYAGVQDSGVAVIYLVAQMALFDCHTSSPLAVRWVASNKNEWTSAPIEFLPIFPVSADIAGTTMLDWSAQKFHEIKTRLVSVPASAWESTVRSMFLEEGQ